MTKQYFGASINKIIHTILLGSAIFGLSHCAKTTQVENTGSSEVDFCKMLETPDNYLSNTVETKALILGYHGIVAFQPGCNERSKVVELELGYEQRKQIMDQLASQRRNYDSNVFNNNIYAEIKMVGTLNKNDAGEQRIDVKYKFSPDKILEVGAPAEEILPSPK